MTLTRSQLRKDLQEIGFTYREARNLVGAIIDAITKRLKNEGTLDAPFGTLTIKTPVPRRAFKLGRIVTINKKKRVHFRSKKG